MVTILLAYFTFRNCKNIILAYFTLRNYHVTILAYFTPRSFVSCFSAVTIISAYSCDQFLLFEGKALCVQCTKQKVPWYG